MRDAGEARQVGYHMSKPRAWAKKAEMKRSPIDDALQSLADQAQELHIGYEPTPEEIEHADSWPFAHKEEAV